MNVGDLPPDSLSPRSTDESAQPGAGILNSQGLLVSQPPLEQLDPRPVPTPESTEPSLDVDSMNDDLAALPSPAAGSQCPAPSDDSSPVEKSGKAAPRCGPLVGVNPLLCLLLLML